MTEDIPDTPDVSTPCEAPCCETDNVKKDSVYWEFLNQLEGSFMAFMSEARAGDINKSAALRSRKLSVQIRKNLKDFREVSVAHDKSYGRKTNREVKIDKELESLDN